jgi:hypothetical protein
MSHLETASDDWENEGGSLSRSVHPGSWGVLHFVTGTYVVDGHAYANLSDAVSRKNALDVGGMQ